MVWSAWLIYGLVQGRRLIPGITGTDLNSQLDLVAGHFALYTWLLVIWIFVTGTVFAWPWLRSRQLPAAKRALAGAAAGIVCALLIFFVVSNVNVALVRADVVYKQGQQFDSQRNWLSSVELYRRALKSRTTEDHYMLFLGRSLLEQAKQTPVDGAAPLPPDLTLDDVLALEPNDISQTDQQSLLRAAEVILLEAQRVNPLNTDHTANLSRLYRTWADLSRSDPDLAQEMLDKSIAQYNMAVTLSPNAAHLWNEKGNAHLARSERDQAEEAYLYSLELDPVFDQTYLLLSDFYEGNEEYERMIALLEEGIERMNATRRQRPTPQMFSYLGVALARNGDTEGAVDANLQVLERSPNDYGAMRNLAILYRDLENPQEAIIWAVKGAETATTGRPREAKQLHQLAAELYQQTEQPDQVLAQYELMRALDAEDTGVLRTLSSLYAEREEWNKAVEVLQVLTTLDPAEFRHPLAIAQILQEVGQESNALSFAQRALELAPAEQKPAVEQLIAELIDP
jgi:tetratricopeptide (TPR) repeat protein